MDQAVPPTLARMCLSTDSEDDHALSVHKEPPRKPLSLSDSEDDDDDLDTRGLSAVANLNIPDRLKRLMRVTNLGDDDSDSEDDDPLKDNALFRTPAAVKAAEVQSMLRTAPPPPPEPKTLRKQKQPQKTKKKKQTEPPAAASDCEDGSTPSAQAVDPMSRSRAPFTFLDDSSSSSSSDEGDNHDGIETQIKRKTKQRPAKRAMSKQAELKMRMENQRLLRQTVATLQPRMNKLSFTDIVERLKNKQQQLQQQESNGHATSASLSEEQEMEQQQQKPNPTLESTPERRKRAARYHARMLLQQDDDLEIVNIPPQLRALAIASPEQPRHYAFQQFQQTSPHQQRRQRHILSHGDLNKRLQSKIAHEMLNRRKELQDMAKARGEYKSAAEIAQEQLAKEKQAEVIGLQIKQHFTKDTSKRKPKNTLDHDDEILAYSGESDNEAEEEDEAMGDAEEGVDGAADVQLSAGNEGHPEDELWPAPLEEEDGDMVQIRKRKWKNAILSDSDGSENDDGGSDAEEEDGNSSSNSNDDGVKKYKQNNTPKTNHYLDAEAEEEEDEFFGAGGPEDSDDGEDLDRFEQDGMLVDKTDEHVNEEALRAALNSQLAESDRHMVDRLVKDILSGDLRRRRAARESGLMLDDFDLLDDREDNDLVALRRAANEERRRRLQNSGDPLVALARDPKTAAFAKALQPLPENAELLDLSDHEENNDAQSESPDEDDDGGDPDPRSNLSLVIPQEEDEEEEEEEDAKMIVDDDDDDDLEHALSMIEQRHRQVASTDQSMRDFFHGRRIGTQKWP
ncbi:MRC1-like domain-containing protein [Dichotomocladium elegans]|nr:MRC1-like domain-containing protein [Dichotomocladium elegans]